MCLFWRYINRGEKVMTTKYFPLDVENITLSFKNIRRIELWKI